MSFGLGINGALGGAAQGVTIGSAIPGIGTAVGGIIGGGLGLLGGLFGRGNSTKQQKEYVNTKPWDLIFTISYAAHKALNAQEEENKTNENKK